MRSGEREGERENGRREGERKGSGEKGRKRMWARKKRMCMCVMWGGVCGGGGETKATQWFRGAAHRGVGWVDLEVSWSVLPSQFSTPAL